MDVSSLAGSACWFGTCAAKSIFLTADMWIVAGAHLTEPRPADMCSGDFAALLYFTGVLSFTSASAGAMTPIQSSKEGSMNPDQETSTQPSFPDISVTLDVR